MNEDAMLGTALRDAARGKKLLNDDDDDDDRGGEGTRERAV